MLYCIVLYRIVLYTLGGQQSWMTIGLIAAAVLIVVIVCTGMLICWNIRRVEKRRKVTVMHAFNTIVSSKQTHKVHWILSIRYNT